MNIKKIKTILVGLGGIGFDYDKNNKDIITHAKSIIVNKKLKLVCAIDKKINKTKQFKKKYKIDTSNNLSESLNIYKPEFAVISVDIASIERVTKLILNCPSIKLILLEKPGSISAKSLKNLYKISLKKKVRIFINYNRSYQLKIIKMLQPINRSKFKILYFYSRGFLNNCSHFLNLIFLFLNSPKKIVILKKGKIFQNSIQPDIKLTFNKGEVYFISNDSNNVSHNELIFLNDKFKINSDQNLLKFKRFNLKINKDTKLNFYEFLDEMNIDKKKYQTIVYDHILKNKTDRLHKKILISSQKVLFIYDKILKKYNKFRHENKK